MASHPGSQEDYANVFARLYPEFCPTQTLYLDMERDLYVGCWAWPPTGHRTRARHGSYSNIYRQETGTGCPPTHLHR